MEFTPLYRRHLHRLNPGFVLDIGAGNGRTLSLLGGNGVGVDAREEAVRAMRSEGLRAFTPEAFLRSEFARPGLYDSLLLSQVLEPLTGEEAESFVPLFLPYLKKGGRLFTLHRPGSAQVSSLSATQNLDRLFAALGLRTENTLHFPLPGWAGRLYAGNESLVVARA